MRRRRIANLWFWRGIIFLSLPAYIESRQNLLVLLGDIDIYVLERMLKGTNTARKTALSLYSQVWIWLTNWKMRVMFTHFTYCKEPIIEVRSSGGVKHLLIVEEFINELKNE